MFGKAYKEDATDATAANGFRTTRPFTCDKNIFRPQQDFPLASGSTDAAPMNHPALVQTSDQPSFNSSNFHRLFLLTFSEHQITTLCQT